MRLVLKDTNLKKGICNIGILGSSCLACPIYCGLAELLHGLWNLTSQTSLKYGHIVHPKQLTIESNAMAMKDSIIHEKL